MATQRRGEESGVKERGAQRFMNYDALTDTQYIL